MAQEKQTLTPEQLMALTAPRKGHSISHIGIYALLVLLAVGEIHMLNRISNVRNYVDQRDRIVQTNIQAGFQKKLAAESAGQKRALESATKRIERRFSQMQGRASAAQADAARAARRLEQMQSAEDAALLSIQHMLAEKASRSDVRALANQIAETRSDIDLAGAQVARLGPQVNQLARRTDGKIDGLQEQVAALRRKSPRFVPFSLIRNRSQTVGGIAMVLTKTHPRNGHFDLRMAAHGAHLERKNAVASVPIIFVPGNPEHAYEVVVNAVGHDEVRGFLEASGETLPSGSDR